jgi:dipeptide transport system ATP-binding protein
MALMLITHDLGVVAEIAQRVLVMYAGQIVETAPVPQLFETPHHPYTEALLAALPEHNIGRRRLRSMPGMVPGAGDRPAGCLLAPRCAYVQPRCIAERPDLFELGGESRSRCFFAPNTPAAVAPSRGWIAGGQAGDEPITDEPIAAARIADGGLSGRVVDRSR